MADEDKVFLAVPGLHVVSDYVIGKQGPGVRRPRRSRRRWPRSAPTASGLIEPLEPTFKAWAAFGRHYLEPRPITFRA